MKKIVPKSFLLGAILGLVVAGIITFTWLVLTTGERLPRISEQDYQAALTRWNSVGPADYRLEIELGGNRPGKIEIEAHAGEVTRMVRDGVEPKQHRTWYYWSVPGMLDTIGQELEKVDDPVAGFQAPPGSTVILRGRFDAKYGYPIEYHRVILGSNLELRWRVNRFEVLPESEKVDPPTAE